MPMVWYIPPLSPVVDVIKDTGHDAEDRGNLFAAIDALRIPVEYLANLFTAGDVAPVDAVLRRLAAMRSYMRDINLGRDPDDSIPASVGMEPEAMYDMFRLLALAKYDERYVIPAAHAEEAHALEELATECPVSDYGGGNPEIFGEGSGGLTPVAVENFEMLRERQTSETLVGGGSEEGPGQPAQLGRQGPRARGAVPRAPARGSTTRGPDAGGPGPRAHPGRDEGGALDVQAVAAPPARHGRAAAARHLAAVLGAAGLPDGRAARGPAGRRGGAVRAPGRRR